MGIQLPTSTQSSILTVANDTISGMSGVVYLILGVILAVVVIEILVNALRPK